jgi:hypothetical protein
MSCSFGYEERTGYWGDECDITWWWLTYLIGVGLGAAAFVGTVILILLSPFPACRQCLLGIAYFLQVLLSICSCLCICITMQKPVPPPDSADYCGERPENGWSGKYRNGHSVETILRQLGTIALMALFWPAFLVFSIVGYCLVDRDTYLKGLCWHSLTLGRGDEAPAPPPKTKQLAAVLPTKMEREDV